MNKNTGTFLRRRFNVLMSTPKQRVDNVMCWPHKILFTITFTYFILLFADCMKTGFERLLKAEEVALLNHDSFRKYVKVKMIQDCFLTGSFAQGSFSAGFFILGNHSDKDLVRGIDVDIEYILPIKIPQDCLHNVEKKPGYTRILSSCTPKQKLFVSHWEILTQSKYIPTYLLKNVLRTNALTKSRPNVEIMRFFFKLVWKSNTVIDVADWKAVVKKATCQVSFTILMDGERTINFTIDITGLVKTDYPPTMLKELQERTTFSIPNNLLEYIFIIPKPSLEEKNIETTTEWSYSFSHIENHIFVKEFTETQRLVYLIFKSMINKHLKHLDQDTITSYTLKTLLFWKCHLFPSTHPYWNESNTMVVVQALFEDFLRHLRTGFLSNYFVPQMNVMEKFNTTLRKRCIEQIKMVILPNMKGLIEWHETIRLIEIGTLFKHKFLDVLQALEDI